MRVVWFFLCAATAGAAACAVDPELTCGAPCADAAASDTGPDGTVADASDAGGGDAANDVTNDVGSCKAVGALCQSSSSCCSGACNEFGNCAASCAGQGSGCSQQTCCIGLYCSGTSCTQCKQDGTSCVQDYECCGGACQSSIDAGGMRCTTGN